MTIIDEINELIKHHEEKAKAQLDSHVAEREANYGIAKGLRKAREMLEDRKVLLFTCSLEENFKNEHLLKVVSKDEPFRLDKIDKSAFEMLYFKISDK